jgi:hypothetical protein
LEIVLLHGEGERFLLLRGMRKHSVDPPRAIVPLLGMILLLAATVGAFPQDPYERAGREGFVVVSMKGDGKRIFSFD